MREVRRRQSFTLVELIAVIAIVGIIVGVVIPVAINYVQEGRRTADRQTLEVLNDAINRYKMQGGDLSALTSGKPYSNLLAALQTPVSWNGLSHQFLRGSGPYEQALTVDASGTGRSYQLTRYNTYDAGGGSTVLAGGVDQTGEFNIAGATYYAIAPSGYSYSDDQTSHYDTRKYNTLFAAEAALPATPTTPMVINIIGEWTAEDATSAYPTFSGTATSATEYIVVRTIGEARHSGTWSTSAYRHHVTRSDWVCNIYVAESYITFSGLQLMVTQNGASQFRGGINTANVTGITIDNCIIVHDPSSTSGDGTGIHLGQNSGSTAVVRNCIVYGFNSNTNSRAFRNSLSGSCSFLNCTAVDSYIGFHCQTPNVVTNCLAQGCTDGFNSCTGTNSNNCSNIVSDAPGTNPVTGTVQFVGGSDYHLAAGDTVARGAGADLSGSFTTDIDGDTRTVPWSIGADQ